MDPELYIFLTAVVGLVTAIIVGTTLIFREVKGMHTEVKGVRREVNGRMDELLELTRKSAYAAGVEEGQDRPSSRE